MRKLRFYELLLLVFIAIVLGAWSVKEITNSAIFCGSTCHVMRPYYEDWKGSAHDEVACVDCHLEPTDEQQFVPEFRALGQVASYLTRAYSDHTRAEVSDANCLTERCHSRRLLDGRVTFANNITFDHTPHLQRLRRGKILRCTTCHSRVAMGDHVTVVEDACFICHFKTDGEELVTAQCSLCHDPANLATVSAPEGEFEHGTYIARGVPCQSCHQGIIRGDGQVQVESCSACHEHSMEKTLSEPVELLHRMHVTDHKVACSSCHDPIRHNSHDGPSHSSPLDCSSCHESRHSGIWDMYGGRGATGVNTLPSPMNLAHVGCKGCHTVPTPVDKGERGFTGGTMVAVEAACKVCHGPGYGKMVAQWKKELDTALANTQATLDRVRVTLGENPVPADQRVMEIADRNIRFVRFSVPVHNREYALSVLDKVVGELDRISGNNRQR